ncbi:hypothetical protein PSTT_13846 [Puccinia striiformis]|uniref:Uncharacterized protein n=1 Tax=Puccinia striiformis TaxID=27350 RepID=A0A2S4UPR1_9BASI|nr:hypothetical protein PSTT_13846 [Puccinia striiformis]
MVARPARIVLKNLPVKLNSSASDFLPCSSSFFLSDILKKKPRFKMDTPASPVHSMGVPARQCHIVVKAFTTRMSRKEFHYSPANWEPAIVNNRLDREDRGASSVMKSVRPYLCPCNALKISAIPQLQTLSRVQPQCYRSSSQPSHYVPTSDFQ